MFLQEQIKGIIIIRSKGVEILWPLEVEISPTRLLPAAIGAVSSPLRRCRDPRTASESHHTYTNGLLLYVGWLPSPIISTTLVPHSDTLRNVPFTKIKQPAHLFLRGGAGSPPQMHPLGLGPLGVLSSCGPTLPHLGGRDALQAVRKWLLRGTWVRVTSSYFRRVVAAAAMVFQG